MPTLVLTNLVRGYLEYIKQILVLCQLFYGAFVKDFVKSMIFFTLSSDL